MYARTFDLSLSCLYVFFPTAGRLHNSIGLFSYKLRAYTRLTTYLDNALNILRTRALLYGRACVCLCNVSAHSMSVKKHFM